MVVVPFISGYEDGLVLCASLYLLQQVAIVDDNEIIKVIFKYGHSNSSAYFIHHPLLSYQTQIPLQLDVTDIRRDERG